MHLRPVAALRHIPAAALAVSEPHPSMFGNDANEGPRRNPHWTNENWLKSRFHFSFAEYHNHENQNFGVLRVLNDDLVQPKRGFGTHPHGDMEICTYIVSGNLTHKDSMGSDETLGRGAMQFMTAGTGVRHAEHNRDATTPLRFIQMWIVPRKRGLPPNYGGFTSPAENRQNKFDHMVSDAANTHVQTPIKINQDANIYVAEVSPGNAVTFPLNEMRQAYAVVLEGEAVAVSATNAVLGLPPDGATEAAEKEATVSANMYDAFEIYGGETGTHVTFAASAVTPAHVLVVEMAQTPGAIGRRDIK